MADIDELSIKVEASAQKAMPELDKLISKLTTLSASLTTIGSTSVKSFTNSINAMTRSMATFNIAVRTNGLADIESRFNSISRIDFSNIRDAAKALNDMNAASKAASSGKMTNAVNDASRTALSGRGMGSFASSSSSLLSKTITAVSYGLRKSFSGVSTLVTQTGRTMSGVLPAIAKGFTAVRSGAMFAVGGIQSFTTALNGIKNIHKVVTSRIGSIISSLRTLYIRIFFIKRILTAVSKLFTGSMNFIETYHYFDVAMTKIGNDNKEAWAENGYESAEEYSKSFSKRALELNKKMTGYTFENGYGTYSGERNLGLDSDTVMKFQAQYAQMADSIGMAGEAAYATSEAMVMLAGDWSSLKNISFQSSFEKMASALAGQSRAVRSLGIDITQGALQQTLYNIGLDVSISKLTQAQKAEVRMIAILQQSKVAYGDLAKTINTPANQMRMLTENVKALGRTIGNIFLPIVAKVLPVMNAIVLALRQIFEWIAALIGIDVSSLVSSTADIDTGLEDFAEETDDVAENLEDAEEAAEKLKRTIMDFDELHVLGDKDDSSKKDESGSAAGTGIDESLLNGALLNALDEYKRVWNEAFESVSNKAQELADKITNAVKKIYDYFINKDWEGLGNYVAGGVNSGLQKIYDYLHNNTLVDKARETMEGLALALNSIIDKVDFNLLGRTIGAGFNNWIDIMDAWYDNFDSRNYGRKLADAVNGFFDEVHWEDLGALLGDKLSFWLNLIGGFIENVNAMNIGNSLASLINGWLDNVNFASLGQTLANGINKLVDIIKGFTGKINWGQIAESISSGFNAFIYGINWTQNASTLAKFVNSLVKTITTAITNIDWRGLGIGFTNGLNTFVNQIDWYGNSVAIWNAFNSVLSGLNTAVHNFNFLELGYGLSQNLKGMANTINWSEIGDTLGTAFQGVWDVFYGLTLDRTVFEEFGKGFGNMLNAAMGAIEPERIGETIANVWNDVWAFFKNAIETIHWSSADIMPGEEDDSIAKMISDGLNGVFDKIDINISFETITKLGEKIVDCLKQVAANTNFREFGEKVGEALKNVPQWFNIFTEALEYIGGILGELFIGVLEGAFGDFGSDFAQGFVDGLSSVIALGEGTIRGIATALGALAEVLEKLDPDLVEKLGRALGIFFGINITAGLGSKIMAVATGLNPLVPVATNTGFVAGVASLGIALKKFGAGVGAFLWAFEESTVETAGVGEDSFSALEVFEDFSNILDSLGENAGMSEENLNLLAQRLSELQQNVQWDDFESAVKGIADILEDCGISSKDLCEIFKDEFPPSFEAVVAVMEQSEEKFAAVKDVIKEIGEESGLSDEQVDGLIQTFSDNYENCGDAKEAFEGIKDELYGMGVNAETVDTIFKEHFPEAAGTAGEAASGLKTEINELNTEYENIIGHFNQNVLEAPESVKEMRIKIAETLADLKEDGSDFAEDYEQYMEAFDESIAGSTESGEEAFNEFIEMMGEKFGLGKEEIQTFTDAMKTVDPRECFDLSSSRLTMDEFVEIIDGAFDDVIEQFGGGASAIGEFDSQLQYIDDYADTANEAIGFITTHLENMGIPAEKIVEILKEKFPDAFVDASNQLEPLEKATGNLNTEIGNTDTLFGNLKTAFGKLPFADLIQKFSDAKEGAFNFDSILDSFSLASVWRIIKMAAYGAAAKGIGDNADDAGLKVKGLGQAYDYVHDKYVEMAPVIKEDSKNINDAATEGFLNGFGESEPILKNATEDLVEKGVKEPFQEALDMHSPSRVMEGYAENTVAGYVLGINDNLREIQSAITTMKDSILTPFTTLYSELSGLATEGVSGLISGLSDTYSVSSTAFSIRDAITSAFDGMWSVMYGIGQSISSGLSSGIASQYIQLPHIGWNWNTITFGNGGWVQVPDFFLNWYAKGGLFTTPTVAGFGEAGDEAALPLTNKGVMSRIANAIVDASDGFNGMTQEDMIEAVSMGVAMAMAQNPQTVEVVVNSVLKTNDEKLAQSVSRGQAKLDRRFNPTPKYNY